MKAILFPLFLTLLACGGKNSSKTELSLEQQFAANLTPQVGDTSFTVEAGHDHDFIVDKVTNMYAPTTRKLYNTTSETILKIDGDVLTVLVETVINGSSETKVVEKQDETMAQFKDLVNDPRTQREGDLLIWTHDSTYYQNGSHPGIKIPLESKITRKLSLTSRCFFSEDLGLKDPKNELPAVTIHKYRRCGEALDEKKMKKLDLKRVKTCPMNEKCRHEDMSHLVK